MIALDYPAKYLTSILKAFNDLMFVFNAEGDIVDYIPNRTSHWLYVPKEQFVGRNHRDVLPPHVSARIDEAMESIRKGDASYTFDYNLAIKGKTVWFTAVFSAIETEHKPGAPKYLCVIREITERKEKELLLQRVLDNAFNAFVVFRAITSNDGHVVDFEWLVVNREAEKLIGKNAIELKQKRLVELPEQQWVLFNEYIQVMETGKPLDLEHTYVSGDVRIWLHTHAMKIEDCLAVTIQNITAKKQADLELQAAIDKLSESRKRMDLFFSQALSGFFFIMMDEPMQWDETIDKEAALDYAISHLHFTRINEALLQQYGATHDQFMKLTVKDFFRRDIQKGRELLRQLFDHGRIHINRASQRMDGSDLWLEGNYITFKDSEKRIQGYFGIQQDVTIRKRAEDSLRASEERYRLLANNMLDMVALHEPDGTYKYVSPSVTKILGYSPQELIGANPYRLFHPDDILSIQEQSHQKAMQGKEIADIEYRIQKKDGQYIWFSTNTKPIKGPDGKVTMLQTVSRDVTEKKEALDRLEELNHQKNKLFSIIAHDLRGPLASCMGLLDLALRTDITDESHEKFLRLAKKSTISLHDLMEDLLLWAGSQLDRVYFAPVVLILKSEIDAVTSRFADVAVAKQILINVSLEADDLAVYADRDMFRTIIRNLLSNAIKFTKPGGHADITAKQNKGFVEISVSDNGIGIKREDIDKLFSKTSTYTTYGTSGEKGTGLGLDVCKDFIEKNGGNIRVESEFGAGSKFTFTLPEATDSLY